MKRRALYANLAERAGTTQNRHTRSEVKYVATANVREMRRHADKLASEYRVLD